MIDARERPHDALGHFAGGQVRRCLLCGASLDGRVPQVRYCASCPGPARRKHQRTMRLQAVAYMRPRCMICDNPIQYKRPNKMTCSLKCSTKRYVWFVRPLRLGVG